MYKKNGKINKIFNLSRGMIFRTLFIFYRIDSRRKDLERKVGERR